MSDGTKDAGQAGADRRAGAFRVAIGEAKSLAVSHEQFDAWPAAIPASGEMTIRLPEPARVEIKLDIDGADKESVIILSAPDRSHMPEFARRSGSLRCETYAKIANPGKLVLAGLPPGRYQFCRRTRADARKCRCSRSSPAR